MKILYAGTAPKDFNFPESNEDTYALDQQTHRFALSDGASESFDSKLWAKILADKFILNPALDKSWLADGIQIYSTKHDFPSMSWSKQASFERGSFATLIGVEYFPTHQSVDVLCVGDSLAVFIDELSYIDSFSYTHAFKFKERPELLSTSASHNQFLYTADFFATHHKTWSFAGRKSPKLLCMTDALGEWALKCAEEDDPQWEFLCSISSDLQLAQFVRDARDQKQMRIDDSTLMHFDLAGIEADELSQP